MSRPIVVTACMPASSDPWPPHRRPPPWHLRAGGGAVHSIKTGPPETLGRRKRGWETSADLLLSLAPLRNHPRYQALIAREEARLAAAQAKQEVRSLSCF